MYRYSEQYFTKQRTTQPWMRWVAAVFCILLLGWMSIVWARQGKLLPGETHDLGAHMTLPEHTYAAVILFNERYRDLIFDLTDVPHTEILIGEDGAFSSAKGVLNETVRPAGWFLPGTVGVLYIQEGNRVATKRIVRTPRGLKTAAPFVSPMQTPFPETAQTGFRCNAPCTLEGGHVAIQDIDIVRDGGDIYISGGLHQKDTLLNYARQSGETLNPVKHVRRAKDGNTITELVPSDNLSEVTGEGTTLIGGDQYTWQLQEYRDRIVLTNTESGAKDLSTLPWTNTVCDTPAVAFYTPDSSQRLAEKSPTLIRTPRSWLLCEH